MCKCEATITIRYSEKDKFVARNMLFYRCFSSTYVLVIGMRINILLCMNVDNGASGVLYIVVVRGR